MWFWVCSLVSALLLPVLMIPIGARFMKRPPKAINRTFGYRTRRSMQSAEAWTFAHRYYGRRVLIIGAVLLPLSLLAMLAVRDRSENVCSIVLGILMLLQVLAILLPIPCTERELKNRFEE